jgi:hypothetical protein
VQEKLLAIAGIGLHSGQVEIIKEWGLGWGDDLRITWYAHIKQSPLIAQAEHTRTMSTISKLIQLSQNSIRKKYIWSEIRERF